MPTWPSSASVFQILSSEVNSAMAKLKLKIVLVAVLVLLVSNAFAVVEKM
jgi:hypothetical protein